MARITTEQREPCSLLLLLAAAPLLLLLFGAGSCEGGAFVVLDDVVVSRRTRTTAATARSSLLVRAEASASQQFKVPATELDDKNMLSAEERTVVNVIRKSSPSVAFVTSVLPAAAVVSGGGRQQHDNSNPNNNRDGRGRFLTRQRRQSSRRKDGTDDFTTDTLPPRGQPLGSGSAFLVHRQGYLVTNYHVIERAYRIQRAARTFDLMIDELAKNVSAATSSFIPSDAVNATIRTLLRPPPSLSSTSCPQVYVKIDSSSKYRLCDIIDVRPELDIAVLKVVDNQKQQRQGENGTAGTSTRPETFPAMTFGSSSDLLVGQNLIAIGNPFGLESTVTTGVVSALNRELQTANNNNNGLFFSPVAAASSQPIRNCIQTDCAINPGNSGGPLLNAKGEVVGVNTAIITTSGSNAGIGFAVPSDQVRPAVEKIIRDHRVSEGRVHVMLGVSVVHPRGGQNSTLTQRNWITRVYPDSPAARAGMVPLSVDRDTAKVVYGDAIVAINGNDVSTPQELQDELSTRFPGEQLQVTLESGTTGERRVVYLTLDRWTAEAAKESSTMSPLRP